MIDYDDINLWLQVMADYVLEDGLVYRRRKYDLKQLYVPAEMEYNIVRLIHEKIGHQSVKPSIGLEN